MKSRINGQGMYGGWEFQVIRVPLHIRDLLDGVVSGEWGV